MMLTRRFVSWFTQRLGLALAVLLCSAMATSAWADSEPKKEITIRRRTEGGDPHFNVELNRGGPPGPAEMEPEQAELVLAELERILNSRSFKNAVRSRQFAIFSWPARTIGPGPKIYSLA